jgi:hypothetical protein
MMIHSGKRSASTSSSSEPYYSSGNMTSSSGPRSIKVASATVCEFNGIYIEISAEADGNTF